MICGRPFSSEIDACERGLVFGPAPAELVAWTNRFCSRTCIEAYRRRAKPMRSYVMAISLFFRVTWLHATVFLTDAEIRALEEEMGWHPKNPDRFPDLDIDHAWGFGVDTESR